MHFVKNEKKKGNRNRNHIKNALEMMKESKGKHPQQPSRDEREVIYSQIAQNMEKTRNVARNSIS